MRGGRGSGDTNVSLGVSIEGVDDTVRAINLIAKTMEGMNAGAANGGNSASGFAPSTPPGAPRPGNGLNDYATGYGAAVAPGGGTPPTGGILSSSMPAATTQALPPGVLAPNPLHPGGGTPMPGGSGGTIINAGNVTIVQSGGAPAAAGWPGGVMPSWATPAGGNTGGGGGGGAPGNFPLPGYNPFGGGGGAPSPNGAGFAEQLYNALGQGWRGAAGARFFDTNPLGRQIVGGLSGIEGMLPAGFASGAASFLGAAALPLAVAGAAVGTGVGIADFFASGQMARYHLATDIMASQRAGNFVDPRIVAARERVADAQGGLEKWDNFRGSVLGWGLRVASFGAADYYWNRFQHPAYERNIRMLEAGVERTQLGIQGTALGLDGAPSGDTARLAVGIAGSAAPFGSVALRTAAGDNYHRMLGLGATQDSVSSAEGVIYSLAGRPEFGGLYRGLRSGTPASRMGGDALRILTGQGDVNSIASLYQGRLITRDQYEQGLTAARAVQETQMNLQIGQAGIGTAQSGIGLLQVTGGSYRQIAGAEGSIGGLYNPQIKAIDDLIKANPDNPLMLAQLRQQRAQMVQARAAAPYQAAMTVFQGRGFEIETGQIGAETALNRAMYTGSESDVVSGYGGMGAQLSRRAALLRDQAASKFYSPEQRERFRAEAARADEQISIDLPRQRGAFQLGLRQSEIGIAEAGFSAAASHAGLFGSIGEVYRTQVGQTSVIRSQMALNQMELGGAFGPRTQQERDELVRRQIELQRQLNDTLEMARRQFASATLGVAQFTQSMTASRAGVAMQYFGVGGAGAASLQSGTLSTAQATLATAQANFAAVQSLPASNPYRQQRERELQEARAGLESTRQEAAHLPFSVDLDRDLMATRFRSQVLSRTFVPYGDVRGNAIREMNTLGSMGRELGQQQQQALRDLDSDPTLSPQEKQQRRSVLLRDFESRRYDLGGQMVGVQQQLETGWMDRIISAQVNAPSRSRFITSQFTAHEMAPFLQNMTSMFGFSGPGGMQQRDFFLHRGPLLANSLIGNISRPEGFNATGLAMAGAPSSGGVLTPRGGAGSKAAVEQKAQELVQAIMAALGLSTGSGQMGNPLGRGRSSSTIHDVQNNQNLIRPPYPGGMSRQ